MGTMFEQLAKKTSAYSYFTQGVKYFFLFKNFWKENWSPKNQISDCGLSRTWSASNKNVLRGVPRSMGWRRWYCTGRQCGNNMITCFPLYFLLFCLYRLIIRQVKRQREAKSATIMLVDARKSMFVPMDGGEVKITQKSLNWFFCPSGFH